MYDDLFDEIKAINKAFGWHGALDALMYMQGCREEYPQHIQRQFNAFMREGAKLFAPAKETA